MRTEADLYNLLPERILVDAEDAVNAGTLDTRSSPETHAVRILVNLQDLEYGLLVTQPVTDRQYVVLTLIDTV